MEKPLLASTEFVVVFQQVCTDLGRDFADLLQILKVPRLWQLEASAPSTDFESDLGLETG